MSDLSLTVQYKDKKVAGQFLTPLQTRDIPIITYNGNFNKLYTIIMYDPNAVNGNYIHFVNINIPNGNITNGQILLSYKGPNPPPKTKIHKYIFLLFEQKERITYQKINDRTMSLENLTSLLKLYKPNAQQFFTSKNDSGGKKTRSKNKKNRKTRKVSFFFT